MGRPVDGPGKKPPMPPRSEEFIFDEDDIKPPSKEYEFKEGEPGTIITGRRPVEEVFSDGEGSTITVKRPDKRLAQVTKPPKGKVTFGTPVQLYPAMAKGRQGRLVDVQVAIPKNVMETKQILQEGYAPLSRERLDARSLAQLPKEGTIYISPAERAKVK